MRRFEPFFVILLFLVSCAPAAPVATATVMPVPSTETSVPTSEPTSTLSPTSTSIPEPTATLTATPYPIPEGAVKTADGASVFVKEGKLWQLDAQGQAAEKDILDVIFANVIDSGTVVKQLHPEYYENNQELLKKTLLPEGVTIDQKYKWLVEDFVVGSSKKNEGIYTIDVVGYALNVSRVKWGDKSVAVMNIALVGAGEPIPVVIGAMENDSEITPFVTQIYSAQVGTNAREASDWGEFDPPSTSLESLANFLSGKRVEMDVLGFVNPENANEFYGRDFVIESLGSDSDYSIIVHDSATRQMASIGWRTREENKLKPKQDRFKTSGEFLDKVMEKSAENLEDLGLGFIINNDNIFLYENK